MNKKIVLKVNEKCGGCGICYTQYPSYFVELEDGKAKSQEDILCFSEQQLENIQKSCPCKAIVFESVNENVIQIFVSELEKLKYYTIHHLKRDALKFNQKEYNTNTLHFQQFVVVF